MVLEQSDQINSALVDFDARFVKRSAEEQISFLIRAEEELGRSKDKQPYKAIALALVWVLYRRAAAKRGGEGVCHGA
ncbi:MAG: hypothetical protein KBA08_05920 [Firmicutes bacterium]|nr:hypothetical protein [Bacillota bacterium]